MKKSQKGSTVVILLSLIVIVLVVIAGVYIYYQNKPAQPAGDTSSSTATTTSQTAPSSSNSSAVSVAGMQQYTDTNFGFSFWYPNTWTIQNSIRSYITLANGSVIKTFGVGINGPNNNGLEGVGIIEFTSSDESITDTSAGSPAGDGSLSLTYFFNPDTKTWMSEDTDGANHVSIKPADVSTNTMGGLHMLYGNARFGDDIIIPLSANNFLVVFALDAGGTPERYLPNTILALNPKVATPESISQQEQIVRAEGLLYGGIGDPIENGQWYIDGQSVYDSQGNLVTGANSSTFKPILTYSDGYTTTETPFATDGTYIYDEGYGVGNAVLEGAGPTTFVLIRQAYQIPYTANSGKYGQSFTSYDIDFEKDATHVWYENKLIPGADPNTFVVTGLDIAHDANHSYGVDNNNYPTIDGVSVSE